MNNRDKINIEIRYEKSPPTRYPDGNIIDKINNIEATNIMGIKISFLFFI